MTPTAWPAARAVTEVASPKLLGLVVANPGSAESTVFARLLAHRGAAYEVLVVHQDWIEGRAMTDTFGRAAQLSPARVDLGWRPSHGRPRRRSAKALSLLRLIASIPRLYGEARSFGPDLVYSSQQRWDFAVAARLADGLGLPHVVHLHYNIESSLGAEVLRRLGSRTHVVAVSDFIRDQAIAHGISSNRVTTIRNSIGPATVVPDARASVLDEFGFGRETLLLGIVARLAPSKGQTDLFAAFASVLIDFPTARLLVIGDGEDRERLSGLAATLGISQMVRFTGQRDDVARLLSSLDVFVHPSRREPFGLAVLEAMAAGLPVIASAEGAFPEFVDDGRTGLLVPAGHVAHLAAALRLLLAKPEMRRSLGAAARCRVEREFRPDEAGRAFGGVVRAVARGRGDALSRARPL